MEKAEFLVLVRTMKSMYQNMFKDEYSVNVWFEMLKDLPYKVASNALAKHINTSEYPPTVASIRRNAMDMTTPQGMNGEQAWSLVFKAIENSNYNSREEFEKLPPLVQKSVGSPANLRELALMPTETVNSVEKSHFIRTYDAEKKRETEINNMPPSVRNLFEQKEMMIEGK